MQNSYINREKAGNIKLSPVPDTAPIQIRHDKEMISALARGARRQISQTNGAPSSAIAYFAPSREKPAVGPMRDQSLLEQDKRATIAVHAGSWVTMAEAQAETGLHPIEDEYNVLRLQPPQESALAAEDIGPSVTGREVAIG